MQDNRPDLTQLFAQLNRGVNQVVAGLGVLSAQLESFSHCFMSGITAEQLSALLKALNNEANEQPDRAAYVRQELLFEAQIKAIGISRKTLADEWLCDLNGQVDDADLDLYNARIARNCLN